jgi:hypothetical protein
MEKKIVNLMIFVLTLVVGLTTGVAEADITSDLVTWWAFNDGSGNTAIDSASGINGTLKPGQSNGPTWVAGKIDDCLEFDTAKQNYVECGPHPALDITGSITLAAWVMKIGPWIGTGGDLRYDTIIYKRVTDGSTRAYRLSRDASSDGVCLTVNATGGEAKVRGPTAVNDDAWHHIAGVYDIDTGEAFVYVDAKLDASGSTSGNINDSTGQPLLIGFDGGDVRLWGGLIDEVRIYARALSPEDIKELYESTALATPRGNASRPSPADGATDVPANVVLSWTPGIYAPAVNGHTVYISESFNDVNDGVGGIAQDTNSYHPGRLDFGTTYYWRVDEVNGPPDYTVYEGSIWSFNTEPIGYPIENIAVTASSSAAAKSPENTINGSGLDDSGLLHDKVGDDTMWLSDVTGPQPTWIEFQFDKVYKLHEMWVWNSNESLEQVIGFGFKDVTIEYSVNGTDYTTLGTTHQFAQAPGAPGYAHNTIIDMDGAVAKYVRLTANSNWGGIVNQYGLSEVRFFRIPVRAREPGPDSGAIDVDVVVTLGFRAGREAARHDVYISTDEQAVIDGTVSATTVTETSHGPLSLDLGKTYYWKINEVNMAETPTTLDGDVWNFATRESLIVDDFESYNDLDPDDPESRRIFNVWMDGYGIATNGSLVGYENPPFCERTIVHGGEQSMPYFYSNTDGAAYSEAELTLNPAQDWTKSGVAALVLYFHGTEGNTGQLYVKINDSKVVYDGDAADVAKPQWQQWNIDLAPLGAGLQNVTKLSVGVDGSGATGTLYFDDVGLYPSAPFEI